MGAVPGSHDNGCLICGRTSDAVPVGVMTEYNGDGPCEGERAWLCGESAQVKDYARAFIMQARDHYGAYGGGGAEDELPLQLPDRLGADQGAVRRDKYPPV